VYADLGFAEPEIELAKADLALRIGATIHVRRLTQKRAATILGIDQSALSGLLRGRLGAYAVDDLEQMLTKLDTGRSLER